MPIDAAASNVMKLFLRDCTRKIFVSELEAAMKRGKRKANRAKITLVGLGRAGKTCVARSFLNMSFEDTPSTQGIDDLGLRIAVHQAEAREGMWGEFKEFDRMYEGHLALEIQHKRCDPDTLPEERVYGGEKALPVTKPKEKLVSPSSNGEPTPIQHRFMSSTPLNSLEGPPFPLFQWT